MTIDQLRERIAEYVSGARYRHTLGVERECAALADIYALSPSDRQRLRIAALLHDITKEKNTDQQQALCVRYGLPFDEQDRLSPKTLHARTGAAVAAADFPEMADEMVCGCIRWHTTGRAGMTLCQRLLYLADYIEDTRTFPDCVELRRSFYAGLNRGEEPLKLLDDTMLLSFDMTIRDLLESSSLISADTILARNDLLAQREKNSHDAK